MSVNKKELFRVIKYTLFALSAGIIQIASSFLLELVIFKKIIPDGSTLHFITDWDKSTFWAGTIGLALSVVWNFTFNRKFTFKAASNVPLSMALAFLFYVPFYPFQIWYMDRVKASLMGSIGEDAAYIVAQITVILINFVLEFLWQRFVVFRKKMDTSAAKNNDDDAAGGATVVAESDIEANEEEDASVPHQNA